MEEIKKKFDEKFGEIQRYHPAYWESPDKDGDQRGVPCKVTYESENIKAFIESEINLAVSKERERVFREIKEYKFKENHLCRFNDGTQDCECFIAGLNVALKIINTK